MGFSPFADPITSELSLPDLVGGALAPCFHRDHAVILDNVLDLPLVDSLLKELEPFIAGTVPIDDEFVGRSTTRTGRPVARSKTARDAVAQPMVLDIGKRFFDDHSKHIQLNLTQIMRILSGGRAQGLHRDRYLWSRSLPREMARELEPALQELLGYSVGNGSLGYFSQPSIPSKGYPDTLPPEIALGRRPTRGFEEQKAF